MPGHAGNNNVLKRLNNSLKKHGGAKLECTTDEDFGYLGNFNPATGVYKDVL